MKKRSDGRYVKVITVNGEKTYIYGKTAREVTRKLMQLTERKEKGRTVEEVAQEWWSEAQGYLALQSIKSYKPRLDNLIADLGEEHIGELAPKQISALLKEMVAQGYAHKTISNQRTVINQVCAYAIEQGDIDLNPCASVPIPRGAKPKVKVNSAGADVERVIAANPDEWLFPYIALFTGLRKGEILALQWKDIDFDRGYISVTKSIAHNGDRPLVKAPKTEEGRRTVLLLNPLSNALKSRRGGDDDYIISDDGRKPMTNRRFITEMRRYREKLGITFTAHQLRHTFATLALGCGADIISVQGLLGHADTATTTEYADYRVAIAEQQRDALNAAFLTRFF